jgi:hypothetical protein
MRDHLSTSRENLCLDSSSTPYVSFLLQPGVCMFSLQPIRSSSLLVIFNVLKLTFKDLVDVYTRKIYYSLNHIAINHPTPTRRALYALSASGFVEIKPCHSPPNHNAFPPLSMIIH